MSTEKIITEQEIVPIVPVNSGVTLSTQNSQTLAKFNKQISPAIRWCFTFHNYTQKDIDDINSSNSSKFLMFAEETGKSNNTPHIQGYIEFTKKTRPAGLWNNTIHWEKAKGNRQQNIDYISKENGKIYINGKLQRKINIIDDAKLWIWEITLLEILKQEPNDRTIYWYWEPNGNSGKSTFVKYCCAKLGAITLSNKSSDMKYGILKYHETTNTYPSIIFIDIPRSINQEHLSYPGIEEVKNGCFFSNKYECQQIIMPTPHIVIFSNKEPDINQLSADRWHIHEITKGECQIPDNKITITI